MRITASCGGGAEETKEFDEDLQRPACLGVRVVLDHDLQAELGMQNGSDDEGQQQHRVERCAADACAPA